MQLIAGLVIIEFKDIQGTTPIVWLPEDLDEQLRVLCGIKAISLLTGENNYIPKSLITIPFPSRRLKALIKFLKWKDEKRRGGIGQAAFILLFEEEHDAIFYKAKKYLEEDFDTLVEDIIILNKKGEEKDKLAQRIAEFKTQIDFVLNDLKEKELSKNKVSEFPSTSSEEDISYKVKTIVMGEPRVGKTSIILRFTDSAFLRSYIPTLGVNISEKSIKFNGHNIQLVLWDLAGQQKYNNVRIHFYKGAEIILLVFDLTNKESFKKITQWYEDIAKNLKEKKDLTGFLIGNKNDLKNERVIERHDALMLAEELNLSYFETSALTGENIQNMFESIGKKMIQVQENNTNL